MPTYESACLIETCERYGVRREWFASTMDKPDPDCEACGNTMRRMVSNFNAPWTGDLGRFNDPTKERFNTLPDGSHYAYRVRSTRNLDGSPERVLVSNRQQQREYCKAEGLMMPDEVGQHVEVHDDGMGVSAQGMPGSWAAPPATMDQGTVLEPITERRRERPTFAGAW